LCRSGPACDQNRLMREQRGRVAAVRRVHGPCNGPRARARVKDFCAGQDDPVTTLPTRNQDFA
jgi:hypothetical protein